MLAGPNPVSISDYDTQSLTQLLTLHQTHPANLQPTRFLARWASCSGVRASCTPASVQSQASGWAAMWRLKASRVLLYLHSQYALRPWPSEAAGSAPSSSSAVTLCTQSPEV